MNLFEQFRDNALKRADAIAASSPRHRQTTYKKLWSRIERATARLQQEWGVAAGDVVAYHGKAHPDALVLYFALARCGALLLPLESSEMQAQASLLAQKFKIKMLVHESEIADSLGLPPRVSSYLLEALIMNPCPFQPAVIHEQMALPSLIEVHLVEPNGFSSALYSLENMMCGISAKSVLETQISKGLFNEKVLATVVLPTLCSGGFLEFS